jgi:hypothetical protein
MDGRELKQYERFKQEAQFLRSQNQHLQRELDTYRPAWHRSSVRIDKLEQRVKKLEAENKALRQKVKDLTLAAASPDQPGGDKSSPAIVVKASVVKRGRKRPGREKGHPAALRPMPEHIDVHQKVPLPVDDEGRESCPWCNSCLNKLEGHERLNEDMIPVKVVVRCYHTRSGYCPSCRKRVESRAPEQPPAANIPHGAADCVSFAVPSDQFFVCPVAGIDGQFRRGRPAGAARGRLVRSGLSEAFAADALRSDRACR